jgi:hypothetical protein
MFLGSMCPLSQWNLLLGSEANENSTFQYNENKMFHGPVLFDIKLLFKVLVVLFYFLLFFTT